MPVKTAKAGSTQPTHSLAARSLRVGLAFSAVGAFAWVFSYAYIEGTAVGGKRAVPLLRADARPIKTRPLEPGGLRVPDRDKQVYARLTRGKKSRKPKARGRLILRPGLLKPIREPKNVADRTISGGRARGMASIEPIRTRTPSKSKRGKDRSPAGGIGAYRVQVAAFPRPEQAARRWRRLAVQHRDLVGKLKWFVEKVDRGRTKGPLYRLQLGPLKSRKSAKELCAELGRRKVSCFGVKG